VSKVRVYELAKELGMDSKAVLAKLQDMGEKKPFIFDAPTE
jgi:translation initiation factor IF-2